MQQPKPPKLLPQYSSGISLVAALESQTIDGFEFNEQSVEDIKTTHLSIDQSKFDRITLTDANFRALQMTDSLVTKATWISVSIPDGGIIRTVFVASRLAAFECTNSLFQDVVFRSSKLTESNFRSSSFVRCVFEDCDLSGADFYDAKFNSVQMRGCNLTKAQFSGSKSLGLDLRGSDLTGLSGRLALHGATIDTTQALALAPGVLSEMGIKIED